MSSSWRGLGADAVATVALTEGMLTIVFGVAMGLSMATTAMVARRTGEKDPRGAAVAAVQAIGIGIVISLAVALVGGLNAPRLLELMGATAGDHSHRLYLHHHRARAASPSSFCCF